MHGLYLLWWIEEKHIPAPTVAVILAVGDLTLMALEVQTGEGTVRDGGRLARRPVRSVPGRVRCRRRRAGAHRSGRRKTGWSLPGLRIRRCG